MCIERVNMLCIIVVLSCGAAEPVWALDQKDVDKVVADKMEELRRNEFAPPFDSKMLALDAHLLLESLKPYQEDPAKRVRQAAYSILWVVGRDSQDPAVRREVVRRLLVAFKDPVVAGLTAQRVLSFRRADFDDEAKELIRELVQEGKPYRYRAILAAGIANVREVGPELRALTGGKWKEEENWWLTGSWVALRALARMGDKQAISDCVAMVEKEPDVSRRVTALLKDLAYIRQPEAVAVLVKYLNSDERLPPRDGGPGRRYAQHAIMYLSETVVGFPVKDLPFLSDDKLETARKWMREHKDCEILR